MAIRKVTPPTIRGGQRVRERWEEIVSEITDNTSVSIDELAAVVFTLRGDKASEIESRLFEIERKIAKFSEIEDIQKEIDQNRRLSWLLHQKS